MGTKTRDEDLIERERETSRIDPGREHVVLSYWANVDLVVIVRRRIFRLLHVCMDVKEIN